jgi:hypothetical protein
MVDLGFDINSVRQMSTASWSPESSTPITLPLFFVTLPRTTKSLDFFKLSSLCHISIKVEVYKSRNTLAVLQLPEVWPRLNQLQTTSLLLVVWGRPHAQRLPGEGE